MWASPTLAHSLPAGRARWQLAAVLVGSAALAWQLPSPGATARTLLGRGSFASTGGVADRAMVVVAALSVWLLLAWLVLVGVVALVARLPGVVGAAARVSLVAMAPVAMRNVLLTVVGASVVTGLAGCATTSASVPDTAGVSATAGAALRSVTMSDASAAASQLRVERLIGIATLRISDRIAAEGSAVRAAREPGAATPGAAAPGGAVGTRAGRAAPSVDWPAPAAGIRNPSAPTTAAAASAHSTASTARATQSTPATHSMPPGISVDWPGPTASSHSAAEQSVVVLRGDSLWAIAARSLPDGADDATVDRTWRAWYAANTSVIGDNPDHLLPGQILQPPTANPGTGTHS